MPDNDAAFTFEEAQQPEGFSFEEAAAAPTSPQGLTPFTGHIPVPPGYDPRTFQRQYGGPWSGALTGPYAQEGMQEAVQTLGAPLRAAGALTEGLMGTASEMAADFLRRTGIDPSAQPGEPLALAPPPGSGKAITQALSPFHAPLPDWAQGAVEEGGRILRGFTEPGQAATLPFAAASKPIQALYLTGAATAIPESIQRIYEAKGPEELGAAITGGAANIGMAELMRRGLTRPTPMERLMDYASRLREDERQIQTPGLEQQVREGQGRPDLERGTPQQPGGAAPSFPQETQVLLDQGLANNRSLGIGHELEVLPDFGAADPAHRRVFQATAPTVDAEGNVTAPGKIRISKTAFDLWDQEVLSKLGPQQRIEAIHRALAEEGIHATVTPKMANDYLKTLTPAEIAAGKKLYLGGVSEAEAGLTPTNLGHELLRQRMQRLLRMSPTELAEARGFQKWSRATIEAVANVIRQFRELVGTAAAKAGGMITDELLNRYQDNLNKVARDSGETEPFPERYGGEQPFMIRRGAGEKKPEDIAGMDDASVTKYLGDLKGKGIGPQYDSVVAGMKLSESAIPELTRLHQESGEKMMKALERGDQKSFEAEFGKNVWYAGAIEGAGRTGPNYERLAAETRNAEIPGLPEVQPGMVRIYHGEGGPEGAGMFSSWFSEDASRAASYGGQVSYVDIPESVAEFTRQLAKKAGSGTSADHFLPDEWSMRAQAVPDEIQQKVYDLGPAALRRGKAKEQRELFLPPAAGEERPSATQLGAIEPVRITAAEISKGAYGALQEMTDKALAQYTEKPTGKIDAPSFTDFGKAVKKQFGQMGTGAIFDLWQDLSWRRLLNASGKNLEALRSAFNLRKKLGDRAIADPTPRTGLLAGEGTAPTFEEAKGAAARQKYRNNVIAQIQEAMLAEATKHFRTERLTVTPEEIGFQRKAIRPAWNSITHEERSNLDLLGTVLTDDAREEGMKVSNTKRLTVLVNKDNGRVEMVSTYRDPRRGAVLLDPQSATKTHAPLAKILEKWTPVQSVLLDEPVKAFRQQYRSLTDFEENFGAEARKLNQEQPEETLPPSGELRTDVLRGGRPFEAATPQVGIAPALRDPLTPEETKSFLESIFEERGSLENPDDIKATLMSETLSGNKDAVLAAKKLALELDRKNPDLPLEQLLDKLVQQIYENHVQAKSFEEFQSRTMAQGPAPGGKAPGAGAQAAAQTGARELTLPTFARRAQPDPAGPGPEPRLPAPQPPEMLSPEAQAELARQVSEKYAEMPAMLRRTKERAEAEFHGLMGRVRATIARAGEKEELSRLRDRASTLAVNRSEAAKRNIEQPSSSGKQKRGDPKTLAAARAINASYRRAGAAAPTPDPSTLPALLQLTHDGLRKATALIQNPTDATLAAVGLPEIKGQSPGEIQAIGRQWREAAVTLAKEVQYAIDHFGQPDLMRTASRLRRELYEQLQFERNAGKQTKEAENYLPGLYEGELYGDNSVTFDSVILGKSYGKPKTFANQYEAIAAGPFIPKMHNVADIAAHRIRAGMFSILADQAFKAPLTMIDPATRSPIAIEAQQSPQGGYQVPGGNLQYKLIYPQGGGKPIAVRRGYAKLMDDLFGRSGIEDWMGGKALMKFGAIEKHTTLAGDVYHLSKMILYALGITRDRTAFRGALTALNMRPQNLAEAVRRGVIRQKDMDWALEPHVITIRGTPTTLTRQEILERFQTNGGFNVGRIQDAMYKHFVDDLDIEIAGRRIGIGAYNRFLFDDLTRGLMANSAVEEFLRQTKAAPGVDADVIMRRISKDLNTQFGSPGKQALVKNPTLRDLGQLVFLAAQWTGSRIATEAKFLSRLASTPYVLATKGKGEAVVHFGSIGRGVGTGMLAMIGLTQALNLISRGHLTFQNPEEDHKLDAWMPDFQGGPGHWISPTSVYLEMVHEVSRYMMSGRKNLAETITQIGENKLSPLGRAMLVGLSGTTPLGQRITTTGGRLREAGKALIPTPITISPLARGLGHALAPSLIQANRPGAIQRQLLSSMAIKSEQARDPLSEAQALARDFLASKGHEETIHLEPTDVPGYSQLRQALRREDKQAVWKVLDALRARGKTDKQIEDAMKKWSETGFVKPKALEDEFYWSLPPNVRETIDEAAYQKIQEYNRFIEYMMLEPHGGSTSKEPPSQPQPFSFEEAH